MTNSDPRFTPINPFASSEALRDAVEEHMLQDHLCPAAPDNCMKDIGCKNCALNTLASLVEFILTIPSKPLAPLCWHFVDTRELCENPVMRGSLYCKEHSPPVEG